ncbi:MAG TPA: DUF115 domain-containing protein [bacterium]|nr:DUF115 domain-containing protein [bacterium]
MGRFEDNLAALATRDPALAARLAQAERGAISIITRGRWPNLLDALTRVTAHPENNPLQETHDVVTRLAPAPLYVVLGAGAGYHLIALQQKYPGVPLAIVEPRLDILAQALVVNDLRTVLARPEVTVIVEDDPDAAAARVVATQPLDPLAAAGEVALRGVDKLYPGFSRVFRDRLRERITVEQRTRATLLLFAPRWQEHFWSSLPAIMTLPPATRLDGAARGRPAFVVGGGPSLDDNGALLARVQGRGVVIAVDTALPPLRRLGVTPDLVVTLDAGWGNAQSLLGEHAQTDTRLVAFPLVDPTVLRAWTNRTLAFNLRHPALRFLGRVREPIDDLRVSGSVVTAAYDLARRMGCNPIALVGVDLALCGERMYTRGTALYDSWRRQLNRYASMENKGRGLYRGLDLTGLSSTRQMGYWRHWLEREAAAWKGRTLNCCAGGVGPGALPRVPLAEVLQRELPKNTAPWCEKISFSPARADVAAAQALWSELERAAQAARTALNAGGPVAALAEQPLLAELCEWEIKVARWQRTEADQRRTADLLLAAVLRGCARLRERAA